MTESPLRSRLLTGATAYLVLSVLRDSELYGYQIAQRIRDRSDGAFAPSEGSLYPALHRLEAEGALAADWREGGPGPRRRWYRITPGGLATLAGYEAEWHTFSGALGRVTAVAEPSNA